MSHVHGMQVSVRVTTAGVRLSVIIYIMSSVASRVYDIRQICVPCT